MQLISALERSWVGKPIGRLDERFHLWAPYGVDEFLRLLDVAIPAARDKTFLDVGCGIGTKCLLAKDRGLEVHGVEWVPEYVAEARQLGVRVYEADIRNWPDYDKFGIVYLNCPFKDNEEEAEFERWLQDAIRSGSVLIQVNDCIAPVGWQTLFDDRKYWCGVWVKPEISTTVIT